jgi:hypothetical protein
MTTQRVEKEKKKKRQKTKNRENNIKNPKKLQT